MLIILVIEAEIKQLEYYIFLKKLTAFPLELAMRRKAPLLPMYAHRILKRTLTSEVYTHARSHDHSIMASNDRIAANIKSSE